MKSIHRKRLQKLADFLKTVPRKQFDIGVLVSGKPEEIGCGSIACAIGHCPIVFPRHWKFRTSHAKPWNRVFLNSTRNRNWKKGAMEFFGITGHERWDLFMAAGYESKSPTPKMVACKIEKFLKDAA